MTTKAYWAYEFECFQPIERVLEVLNDKGPWEWRARDSYWYGDYLNSRPIERVRIRIHEWENARYTILLKIDSDSTAQRPALDDITKNLLGALAARNISEIEPYD